MSYGRWKPYVPISKRRTQAEKAVAKAKKAGQDMRPVVIARRTIARTFWGKAWCDNLEAYSDYENRLPRGRAYVRNGSVIDLVIEPGSVKARVMGSSLYQVEIAIAAVPAARWKSLVKQSAGSIASLVDLLQGKFSKAVMEHLCQPKTGLFPAPKDIRLDCSCPDRATMCKHVAAVLYGVGARLDEQPELLFTLRQVDAGDLVTQAATLPVKVRKKPSKAKVLDDAAFADIFGIELATPEKVPRKTACGKTRSASVPTAQTTPPAKTAAASVRKAAAPKKTAAKREDTQATRKTDSTVTRARKTASSSLAARERKQSTAD